MKPKFGLLTLVATLSIPTLLNAAEIDWKKVDAALGRIAHGPLASVLKSQLVPEIWQDFQQGKTSWSRPWSLYVLERWCELHSVSA